MRFRTQRQLAVLLSLALAACSSPAPESGADVAAPADANALRRAELEQRRDQVEADRGTIGPFRLLSSRYRFEPQKDGWERPMLDLVLENGTTVPVARFSVLLTLKSPDRPEPWLRQEFTVFMKSTLLPGQPHATTLTPSPDSPWGRLQAPTDAIMRVDVMTVLTPDGRSFLGPGAFTPQDAAELTRLSSSR